MMLSVARHARIDTWRTQCGHVSGRVIPGYSDRDACLLTGSCLFRRACLAGTEVYYSAVLFVDAHAPSRLGRGEACTRGQDQLPLHASSEFRRRSHTDSEVHTPE
jgi:hypothetical protein